MQYLHLLIYSVQLNVSAPSYIDFLRFQLYISDNTSQYTPLDLTNQFYKWVGVGYNKPIIIPENRSFILSQLQG